MNPTEPSLRPHILVGTLDNAQSIYLPTWANIFPLFKLSVFEHSRRNGRPLNELKDPMGERPETGLFEFVGPNRTLAEPPEIAVVTLCAFRVTDATPEPAPK